MLVPTMYVCYQIEQSRRQEELRDARLWRLLRGERKRGRSDRARGERRRTSGRWVRELLGSPGL